MYFGTLVIWYIKNYNCFIFQMNLVLYYYKVCYFSNVNTDIYLLFYLFIYLFMAALGLRCCAWTFSSCSERGLLFFVMRGLLIEVASLVVEHGL